MPKDTRAQARAARQRQWETGESYMQALAAVQPPRLDRDQAAATTAMRTMGFAQLMAARAKARMFPAVHQGGAGAVVREAVTRCGPGSPRGPSRAMIEGVLRHCTDASIDPQYTDTHGQSLVGFAFAHLLGFKLLPRIKNVASQKLVKVDADDEVPACLAGMVSTEAIDWELIAQQYDQMVKYATALRLGTAEAEQVLRRFTRGGPKHPTYKAIEELGQAVKSVFIAEFMASQELRREIHEGLQVVENWNSANSDLFYGKAGTIQGGDRENQEVSMLALHPLQSALVFVNTLLVQSALKEEKWVKLTDADRRALSPLFWSHANLYGTVEIDMDSHLDLGLAA